MNRQRIRQPPSSVTGELGVWLWDLAEVVNNTPSLSYFSGTTPNSTLTGWTGDIGVNVGSASTNTRLWQHAGSPDMPSQQSWFPMTIGPA